MAKKTETPPVRSTSQRSTPALAAPRITLDQWRCLVMVVEAGGYAQAAQRLNKSQSSVTYAVQKLQSVLSVQAFEVQGRKAVLTPAGQMLYQRARTLLEEAGGIERAARKVSAGYESEITLAVEILFPTWLTMQCLARFGDESPHTHIEVYETVIEGTPELIQRVGVDLAISPRVPQGFNGDPLMLVRFVPVAHPNHPLHRLGRELTMRDLRKHRHLVVRDTSTARRKEAATLEAEQRWTLTNMSTSIGAACRGYGFAWFPEHKIRSELAEGILKVLPLRGGQERYQQLYLIIADPDAAGPGVLRLAEIIREEVSGIAGERSAPVRC
jgi:DNA-binding transcriptional LysR family regulator